MRRRVFDAVVLGIAVLWGTWARALDPVPYLRGDGNSSGAVDISDAIFILQFLFSGGESPLCSGLSDANADGATDIADAVRVLEFLFHGTAELPALSQTEVAGCELGEVARRGRDVFFSPDPLGNAYSCGHCHDREPAGAAARDGIRRPAHGLGDVTGRPDYFNGRIAELLPAVNRCRSDWMEVPAWTEDDERYDLLRTYLESLWPRGDAAPALATEAAAPAVQGSSLEDPARGCELYARACAGCHGATGAGAAGLGPSLWSSPLGPDALREHVRLSGPTVELVPDTLYEGLLGNRMPFFSRDRLADPELEDLVAYLEVARSPGHRACDAVASAPPRLLRGGRFRTIQHGVRGYAEHWSDRTIRLRDFYYDGQGPPDVLVWLYFKREGDFHAILRGVAISGHMARSRPYSGVDLEFSIPDGMRSAEFNTVAVWCTAFASNYGEAELRQ